MLTAATAAALDSGEDAILVVDTLEASVAANDSHQPASVCNAAAVTRSVSAFCGDTMTEP
ncbi:hypothetical protein AWC16_02045 [Mycolicibacter longobardus]|uniref:Uncharacterized protein n=1 Tax=Mycolicibacter longobardus TaxID=1108812 RepID=A0A1X1YT53_9MYCO|nr:hypothetical protein AWC16_02045 [Mycolicibacter longobardus]